MHSCSSLEGLGSFCSMFKAFIHLAEVHQPEVHPRNHQTTSKSTLSLLEWSQHLLPVNSTISHSKRITWPKNAFGLESRESISLFTLLVRGHNHMIATPKSGDFSPFLVIRKGPRFKELYRQLGHELGEHSHSVLHFMSWFSSPTPCFGFGAAGASGFEKGLDRCSY